MMLYHVVLQYTITIFVQLVSVVFKGNLKFALQSRSLP